MVRLRNGAVACNDAWRAQGPTRYVPDFEKIKHYQLNWKPNIEGFSLKYLVQFDVSTTHIPICTGSLHMTKKSVWTVIKKHWFLDFDENIGCIVLNESYSPFFSTEWFSWHSVAFSLTFQTFSLVQGYGMWTLSKFRINTSTN